MAKQTITAFFESREYANNAALMLKQAGVPESDITVSPDTTVSDEAAGRPATGFWASVEELFGGSDDHATYREGLRRGGTMLIANVDDAKIDDAVRILEQHGSVDLDEHEATWRSEGWTGSAVTGGGIANEGAGPLRSLAPIAQTETDLAATRTTAATAAYAAPTAPARSAATALGSDDTLKVVEEQLDVGKRAVNRGKVRIHSYVVEKAVSEAVTLRDETVTVDRRPVDRPVGVADLGADAFKERTIELDEVHEEAVVAKTARVVEEIGIRKDAVDRVQTVTDTVRSTKVDIEDSRTAGAKAALAGSAFNIADNLEVVGSDGQHVGVVDHLDGPTSIKLKRQDPASGGAHHLIPTDWVGTVDQKVTLKVTAAEAKSRWETV